MKKRAIIIGAGYGGMALANLLGKAGYQVDVYEKNERPGGRISAFEQDGFLFDIGPSWYLMPEVFDQYYALFGESATKRLDLIRFTPGYKVYFGKGEPIVIQGDLEKDAETFEQIEPGAGQQLRKYVETSSLVYNVATKHFLYTNFQRIGDVMKKEIFQHSLRMLTMVFRPLDAYVSKYFKDSRLKRILEYHMVFLGSSPFQAPAIYTLMSHLDFKSGVFYPRRGMLSLADDLADLGSDYDITYHADTPVHEIVVENGTATGVRLDSGIVTADVVISNADLYHTETKLLSQPHQSFPASYWKKRQPGPGALLLSLGVKGVLPQLQHHTLLFVEEWRDNFRAIYEDMEIPEHASMYICNPTKTDPSLAPEGMENLMILVPLPSGVAMTDDETSAFSARIIEQLSIAIDQPDLASRIVSQMIFGPNDFESRYNAWQYNAFGGQSHILRQSIIFRTPNKSRKVKNLYYVGAGTLPGIGLPMCLMSAELVYKRITGIKTGGPLIGLEDNKL